MIKIEQISEEKWREREICDEGYYGNEMTPYTRDDSRHYVYVPERTYIPGEKGIVTLYAPKRISMMSSYGIYRSILLDLLDYFSENGTYKKNPRELDTFRLIDTLKEDNISVSYEALIKIYALIDRFGDIVINILELLVILSPYYYEALKIAKNMEKNEGKKVDLFELIFIIKSCEEEHISSKKTR